MNVIKKLRRKFILISTATVIIIVIGALSLVTSVAYIRINAQIDSFLAYISQNNGRISEHKLPPNTTWFSETDWTGDTPDFPYQLRYFSVLVDRNDYIKEINIKNIAAFTETEAIQYAQMAVQKNEVNGIFKKDRASYAYQITKMPNGDTLIVIMDCTRDMAIIQDFIQDSIELGLVCILLYILILAILCNLAIKPFIHNIENQKRFITNAGHELKTPIAIISANTEAIELINGKNQWTENILKQIKRLSKLITELITLSKMSEYSTENLKFNSTNFSEIVIEVAKSFQQMATDQEKILKYQVKPDISILSEYKYLYELVNILIDNAVKYCDDKGHIDVKLIKSKKTSILYVTNDYINGNHTDYSRFFERFYREDTSHSSEKAGYGIGLSIAEELVKLLKGTIKVSYSKGKITFIVKFTN